jgi:hypothetical protein
VGLVPRLWRSDHFGSISQPFPDLLWNLVAPMTFMRLSSWKGARAVLSSAAWQEIRVRAFEHGHLSSLPTASQAGLKQLRQGRLHYLSHCVPGQRIQHQKARRQLVSG